MSDVREPAPLAPPEDEEPQGDRDTENSEGVAISEGGFGAPLIAPLDDESTPLPPNLPHHLADPTGYSIEKLLQPDHEVVHPEDDATIPEHLRSAQLAPPEEGDAPNDVDADVDADVDLLTTPQRTLPPATPTPSDTEDELTRPRVRMTPEGPDDPEPTK